MDEQIRKYINDLFGDDIKRKFDAFRYLMNVTDDIPVEWIYTVWDELFLQLKNNNIHRRSIAAQLICNLAKSDTEGRLLKDIDKLLGSTIEEKLLMTRHSFQTIWKIAIINNELKSKIIAHLTLLFTASITEKNYPLIRYDILLILRKIYNLLKDKFVKDLALMLIQKETDFNNQSKYKSLWNDIISREPNPTDPLSGR